MNDLFHLADLCTQGDGADPFLDAQIEQALPCSREFAKSCHLRKPSLYNERAFRFYRIGEDSAGDYESYAYTSDIRYALTLLPNRARWVLGANASGSLPFDYHAFIDPNQAASAMSPYKAYASNPARALTAAALYCLFDLKDK